MDWTDILFLALVLGIIMGYTFVITMLAYKHGVRDGQSHTPVKSLAKRIGAAISPRAEETPRPQWTLCPQCGTNPHHPQCPSLQPKEKQPDLRRKGFSQIRKHLESQESA